MYPFTLEFGAHRQPEHRELSTYNIMRNVVQDACQSGLQLLKGTTQERTYERTYKMWFE